MRKATTRRLLTLSAAGGVLALSGGTAYADSGAQGVTADSPGVLSGNSVQVPVHIPVNVCGNTLNVVGLLNPAVGNTCVNEDDDERGPYKPHPEPKPEPEQEKPAPKPEPEPEPVPEKPEQEQPRTETPVRTVPQTRHTEPVAQTTPQLAQTGAGTDAGLAAALGAGLLLGGGVLYRRSRTAAR